MKRQLNILVLLGTALCLLLPAKGQNRFQRVGNLQDMYGERFMVSLVPVPLAFNGFRVDFDCRLKDRLWLQLAPQYNCKRKNGDIKTDGFCLEANLRYYVKNSSSRGFYVASGLDFDYNIIRDYDGRDGDDYYDFYHVNSFRFGGQVQIGYSFRLWPGALMDFYVGAAFRHSFNSYGNDESRRIVEEGDVKPWQYHFRGLFMQAGVRIGLMFGN
ncbi:MAG: DUF3575 domain-containing protein [Bacteroides sp.]|nr:DUF3575 domain-containing protein [Bacteroides sp.]MCM1085140.1 DUF3575 domain-containing protein [Bacteroides sp.]